jgi:hypothetical protein
MHGGAIGTQHLLLAETLGLAMARRASDILERHRATLANDQAASCGAETDDDQFAVDNAIFTAVLDAANECLGRFDSRPADDRWCDALLQVIHLAQLARLSADGLPARVMTGRAPTGLVHSGPSSLVTYSVVIWPASPGQRVEGRPPVPASGPHIGQLTWQDARLPRLPPARGT